MCLLLLLGWLFAEWNKLALVPARSARLAADYTRINAKEVEYSPHRMVYEVVDALRLVVEGGRGGC